METTYTLARHIPSGDVYAVLARDELPMATCGPLYYADALGDLSQLDYTDEDIESGWWDEQEWAAESAGNLA